MTTFMGRNEIKHFGIKGMKWGVRRFQNEDGSLTPAGRARYGYKNGRFMTKTGKDLYEKDKAKENKRLNKIYESEEKRSSKKYKTYVDEYKKSGMSESNAKKAAAKRARAERVLKTVGAVAAGAVAVKLGKSYINKNFDRVVRAGRNLQRVTREGEPIRDAFFASYRRGDNQKYRGLYANQLREQRNNMFNRVAGIAQSPEITRQIRLGRDVRIASERNARKALQDLVNSNSDYKKYFEIITDTMNPRDKARYQAALRNGEIPTGLYREFNRLLVAEGQTIGGPGQTMVKDFYKKLKDAGYDAIQDANDKFKSGYRTSDPLIVFNKDVVSSAVDRAMSDTRIDLERNVAVGRLVLETSAPSLAVGYGLKKAGEAKQDLEEIKNGDKMEYEAVDEFMLQHFGIKGMKWGVRRFQNEDGTLTPAGKKRYAKMEAKREKIKNPKKLTDEELKTRGNRLRSENDYLRLRKDSLELKRQLHKAEHPYRTAVVSTVNKVIIGSGTVAASALITEYAKDGFKDILAKIGSRRIA